MIKETNFSEPWVFGEVEENCIVGKNGFGTVLLRFSEKKVLPIFLPKQWWCRIIAAINFCSGISTDDLEKKNFQIVPKGALLKTAIMAVESVYSHNSNSGNNEFERPIETVNTPF